MAQNSAIRQITHVLIMGSGHATPHMLDYARRAVRQAHQRGFTVLVGDQRSGVALAVVRACCRLYVPIIMAGVGNFPRHGGCKQAQYVKVPCDTYRGMNGRRLDPYTVRDRWLVDTAHIGLFLGDSPDTTAALAYMQSRGKDCWLKLFAQAVHRG